MNDKDKHYLAVAIECDLCDIISEIEKSNREDKKTLIAELINNFITKYKKSFPSVTEDEFKDYISLILQRTNNIGNSNKDEIDDEERE